MLMGVFYFMLSMLYPRFAYDSRNNFHNFFCLNAKFANYANHLSVLSAGLCCIQNKFTMRRQELIQSGWGFIKIIGW